jgi:diguanylate cyclase (GGDEF)-like protein/PAS domain S-box-containing protein
MSQAKVMVVEQGRRTALRLERQLRDLGCAVGSSTATMEQALLGAAHWRPDAIVLDLQLARGAGGRDCVRRLHDDSGAALIFLSRRGQRCVIDPEMLALASGYLVTPCATQDLEATLSIALTPRAEPAGGSGIEASVHRLLDHVPVLLAYLDSTGHYRFANRLHEKWFGIAAEKLARRSMLEVLGPAWNQSVQPAFAEALAGRGARVEHRAQDAQDRHAEVWLTPDRTPSGVRGVYLAAYNITARVDAEGALHQERDDLRAMVDVLDESILAFDAAGHVRYLNPAAQTLTGFSAERARGLPAQEVLRFVDAGSGRRVGDPVRETLSYERPARLAPGAVLLSPDGTEHAVHDRCDPMHDAAGNVVGAVLVLRATGTPDLAPAAAGHDPLTGLMNRAQFEAALDARIRKASATPDAFAVLHIDIDRLDEINEAHGHHAGDATLRRLAELLGSKLRSADLVARLGSDEFAVLAEDCPAHRVQQVAEAVLRTVREAGFSWQGRGLDVDLSIGASTMGGLVADGASVLNAAQLACALAKEEGGGRVAVYRSEAGRSDPVLPHADTWTGRMEDALAQDRFRLFAQRVAPVDDPEGRHQRAFEVLVRLEGRSGTILPPMAFMPADERCLLMARLDRWVIARTLRALSSRLQAVDDRGDDGTRYAINLSAASLADDGALEFIAAQLGEHSIPPDLLCFEIAESAALAALHRAEALAEGLRGIGCGFALDHFSSGVSAREYLQHLPVAYIKIDGSFVKGMLADRLDGAVVEGISRIGQALGIQTVAGHAESQAIVTRLREIGVPQAQGFAIHRPEPLLQALDSHAATLAAALEPGGENWSAEWHLQ